MLSGSKNTTQINTSEPQEDPSSRRSLAVARGTSAQRKFRNHAGKFREQAIPRKKIPKLDQMKCK